MERRIEEVIEKNKLTNGYIELGCCFDSKDIADSKDFEGQKEFSFKGQVEEFGFEKDGDMISIEFDFGNLKMPLKQFYDAMVRLRNIDKAMQDFISENKKN